MLLSASALLLLVTPINFGVNTVYASTLTVEAPKPSLEALISDVSAEYGISSTTLYNLAYSESRLNPDPPGHNDGGRAAGIVQIHYDVWGFTREQVLDPEFSLRFAAEHIKKGDAWKWWTPMNCYTYLAQFVTLPKMKDIVPTSILTDTKVAIFDYHGLKHIALVTSTEQNGFWVKEANYVAGKIGERFVKWGDKSLTGYWSP